jgi:hypothetical protein
MFYCLIFVEPIVNSSSVYEDCVHHAELILSLVFQDKRSDQCLITDIVKIINPLAIIAKSTRTN